MIDLCDFCSPVKFSTCMFFTDSSAACVTYIICALSLVSEMGTRKSHFHVPQLHRQCIIVAPVLAVFSCVRLILLSNSKFL